MRRFYTLLLTLLTCFVLSDARAGAASLSILWDDSHDTDNDELEDTSLAAPIPNYAEFKAFVEAAGHTIVELEGSSAITAAALVGRNVLMIFDPEASITTALTSTEIATIQSFVTGGGMLFIAGDSPNVFNRTAIHSLLAPYGIGYSTMSFNFDLTILFADPLTAGITPLGLDFSNNGALFLLSPAVAGTKVLGTSPGTNIGYAYGANGRVVVMSDADPWTNDFMEPGDNEERALENLLAHFALLNEPTPTPTLTPTLAPTETPTFAPPTVAPTETPTEEPTATMTPTDEPTATPTYTPTPSHTPLATSTAQPSATASATPTASSTPVTPTPTITHTATPASITIKIDIKPGTSPNTINPKSNGVTVVAILTTSLADGDTIEFDPWDELDKMTIRFGPGLAKPDKEPSAVDVDFDGDLDMQVAFRTPQIGATCSTLQLGITGKTYGGLSVIGSDAIVVSGCH